MQYRQAASSAHILLKAALTDVEKTLESMPGLKIDNPEVIVAAFMNSATQIYIHERLQGQHESLRK